MWVTPTPPPRDAHGPKAPLCVCTVVGVEARLSLDKFSGKTL